jgi:PHD/YefM family antitoxin component YafN of YafNO toxin-antitoxin module
VVDTDGLGERLADLHRRVTEGRLRIEVTCPGSDERCVIISKAELDSLEQALELLSDSQAYKTLSESISQLVSVAQP